MFGRILLSSLPLALVALTTQAATSAAPKDTTAGAPAIAQAGGPVVKKAAVTSTPITAAPAAKASAVANKPSLTKAVKKPVSPIPKKTTDADVKAQVEKLITMVSGLEAKLNSIESKIDGLPPETPADKAAPVASEPGDDALSTDGMTLPSSDANELAASAPKAPIAAPAPRAAAPAPTVAAAPSTSVAAPAPVTPEPKIFEGHHRSFDGTSWTFDASGYTLRCQSACPALNMLDDSKPLLVNAGNGSVIFQTAVGARSCQVSRCAAVR